MEEALIHTPLGMARIRGDAGGIQSISVLDEDIAGDIEVPPLLKDAAIQLKEYFEGKKTVMLNLRKIYLAKYLELIIQKNIASCS